jgi:hypothetical protein
MVLARSAPRANRDPHHPLLGDSCRLSAVEQCAWGRQPVANAIRLILNGAVAGGKS